MPAGVGHGQGIDLPPIVLGPAFWQIDSGREQAFLQHLSDGQAALEQALEHGGGLPASLLPSPFDVVAPDQQDGQPFCGGLAALGTGDGFAAMVGLAVADEQVEQVDLEEGVVGVPALPGGGDQVGDAAVEATQGRGVGPVVVAAQGDGGFLGQDGLEELADILFDGLGIGSAELVLEGPASAFLGVGHAALASQGAVGEVPEEAGVGLDEQVVEEGVVLAVFEGLEAVQDEGSLGSGEAGEVGVQEEAVSAEAGEEAIDGAGRDTQVAGDLSVGHAADGPHEEPGGQVRSFEPVGGAEGL